MSGEGASTRASRRAAGLAARDMRGVFVAVQAELLDEIARLIMIVAGPRPAST